MDSRQAEEKKLTLGQARDIDEYHGAQNMRLLAISKMCNIARTRPNATVTDFIEAVADIDYDLEMKRLAG